MNLKSLITLVNSGNVALGSKLASVLSEDCIILEYTNDAVLYVKNNKLFKMNFKSMETLEESSKNAEEISVSITDLNSELNSKLKAVVEGIAIEDFITAESELKSFCELYYQTSILRAKCPDVFVEGKAKTQSKGFSIRKKATEKVEDFKSKIFKVAVIDESIEEDMTPLVSILESDGIVLALGEKKVQGILTEALLGNSYLAEAVTKSMYSLVERLGDPNDDLDKLDSDGYNLEAGMFPDEKPEDIEAEDFSGEPTDELPQVGEGEEVPEFKPLDPSSLSEEESRELHRKILSGILSAMKDFVVEKASSLEEVDIDAGLGDKIQADIDSLSDPEVSDARLSEIEASWQEMLDFFLDSDQHTPEDMTSEFAEEPIETSIPGAGDSEDVSDLDTTMGEENPEEGLGEIPQVEDRPEEKLK